MLEELKQVDMSSVEALADIKKQQDGLKALVDKAHERKGKVSDAIYQRVLNDYNVRLQELETQAQPLREKARAEFAKLRALHEKLKATLEGARLDAQEIDFRHEIGELPDADYETKRKAAEETVTGAQQNFDDADRLSQRFLEVLPPEPEPPPAAKPAPPPPLKPPGEVDTGSIPPAALSPPPPPSMPPLPPVNDRTGTLVAPVEEVIAVEDLPAAGGAGGTMVMTTPRVVLEQEGLPPQTFMLSPVTVVGRTPDNQICINKPEVSRKHARISLGDNGYVLSDLKSGNGTYVNGDRITEWKLNEGDRIEIGGVILVYLEK
jgi:hypothetical protein